MGDIVVAIKRANPPGTVHVPAWLTTTPGLVVHESIGDPGWIVTHQESGLCVGFLDTKDDAIELARLLSSCGDWSLGIEAVRASEMIHRAILQVWLRGAIP
jgi:hypothetical protein